MKKSGDSGGKDEKVREQAPEKNAPEAEEPKDFAEVRRNFANGVRLASNGILRGLIAGAEGGQVAAAKYLFEVAGLYPANEETLGKPEESIVYSLYKQLVEVHPNVVETGEAGAERVKMAGVDEERPRSEGECESEVPELGDERPRPEDTVE
ncbi:MAG: hypothetical protein WAL56_22660 [Candidatus Sulfotelmatobacter sp.]